MRTLLLTSALSLLMLSLQAQDATGNRDALLEETKETTSCILKPGVGVNDFVLQKHSLGKAAREFDSKVEKYSTRSCWVGNWSTYHVDTEQLRYVGNHFTHERKVRKIRTQENSRCMTEQGLKLGSTLAQTVQHYGKPADQNEWGYDSIDYLKYEYEGLVVTMGRKDANAPYRVTELEVYKQSKRKVRTKF